MLAEMVHLLQLQFLVLHAPGGHDEMTALRPRVERPDPKRPLACIFWMNCVIMTWEAYPAASAPAVARRTNTPGKPREVVRWVARPPFS